MAISAAAAIISWRDHLEQHGGGLASNEQSFTVSTMLLGCHQWLDRHAVDAPPAQAERIAEIKRELEDWLGQRGLTYNG
ncbi:hypothetical protein [Devosia riboflavina]